MINTPSHQLNWYDKRIQKLENNVKPIVKFYFSAEGPVVAYGRQSGLFQ